MSRSARIRKHRFVGSYDQETLGMRSLRTPLDEVQSRGQAPRSGSTRVLHRNAVLLAVAGALCSVACGGDSANGGNGLPPGVDGSGGTMGGTSVVQPTVIPGGPSGSGEEPGFVDLGEAGQGSPPAACIELEVEVEKITPTVVVLVDRSGSMAETFASADRWNVLRDTLINPTEGVIARFENDVRFGLSMYTSIDGNLGGECPLLVDVDIALGNFSAIAQTYATTELINNVSDTPTSESLRAVTERLMNFQEIGPKAIILATDGNPDTCIDADDHSLNSQQLSEAAVADAYGLGIKTFVISVGDQVTQAHLQNLANLGVGSAIDVQEPYYQATDAGALVNAFTSIVSAVIPCEFELNGTVLPQDAPLGTVTINGTPATFGEGWELATASKVRLLGETCQAFQQGGSQLGIAFPCGVFTIK